MITVGIPFYNADKYLVEAIRSVFAQTYQDWELILVNDGSTDRSLEIARSVKDPRVRVISDGRNLQLPARLNQIAQEARGDIIARMDADDIMHPERLEKQYGLLQANPGVSCVSSPIWTIDASSQPIGQRRVSHDAPTALDVYKHRVIIHVTLMAYADWFRRNPYDVNAIRCEDYELWCRSFLRGDLALKRTTEPLFFVREEGSVTWQKMVQSQANGRAVQRKYGARLVGRAQTFRGLSRNFMMTIITSLCFACGMEKKLVARRNQPLSPIEKQEALYWLGKVVRTQVPGINTEGI